VVQRELHRIWAQYLLSSSNNRILQKMITKVAASLKVLKNNANQHFSMLLQSKLKSNQLQLHQLNLLNKTMITHTTTWWHSSNSKWCSNLIWQCMDKDLIQWEEWMDTHLMDIHSICMEILLCSQCYMEWILKILIKLQHILEGKLQLFMPN
jgi:hypothetical protein